MYADDFDGHKMAAANTYRRYMPRLERRSVGEADRVGDCMVVRWMQRVDGGYVELNFDTFRFNEKKTKKGDG
jgi:hypothetical protein